MKYDEIRRMQTSLYPKDWEKAYGGLHESCLRAYHITQKIRVLLEYGTPTPVVLELLDMMEEALPGGDL